MQKLSEVSGVKLFGVKGAWRRRCLVLKMINNCLVLKVCGVKDFWCKRCLVQTVSLDDALLWTVWHHLLPCLEKRRVHEETETRTRGLFYRHMSTF